MRRLNRLAVDDARRSDLPSQAQSLSVLTAGIVPLPSAIQAKEPEGAIDGLLGLELAGEEPSLLAGVRDAQERIADSEVQPFP